MVAAQSRGADRVAAHVEDDRVPVHGECRGHLSRERERFDAGAGKIRGDQPDLLHIYHAAMLGQTEVGVHHIEVQQLRAFPRAGRLHGKIQGKLGLAASVIADEHENLFQRPYTCPFFSYFIYLYFSTARFGASMNKTTNFFPLYLTK